MRSDFFDRCAEHRRLLDLKHGNGQYHLPPPSQAELSQMIRLPAQSAGLEFEVDPVRGPLDDFLLDEASKDPGALPLLEFTLDEVWKKSDAGRTGRLTFRAFDELGGVRGAISSRAREVLSQIRSRLGSRTDRALSAVFGMLVGTGERADHVVVRLYAPLAALRPRPGPAGGGGCADRGAAVPDRHRRREPPGDHARARVAAAALAGAGGVGRGQPRVPDAPRADRPRRAAVGQERQARGLPAGRGPAAGRGAAPAGQQPRGDDAAAGRVRRAIGAGRPRAAAGAGARARRFTALVASLAVVATVAFAVTFYQRRQAVRQRQTAVAQARQSHELVQQLLNEVRENLSPTEKKDAALIAKLSERVTSHYEQLRLQDDSDEVRASTPRA